jgi:hypothetical protein
MALKLRCRRLHAGENDDDVLIQSTAGCGQYDLSHTTYFVLIGRVKGKLATVPANQNPKT